MSDREIIVGQLERVNRRLHSERRLRTISSVLAAALIAPLVLKLIDLVSPVPGWIVAAFFLIWGVATIVILTWQNWKSLRRETLAAAAAHLDRTAQLHDEARTAFWFAEHPSDSEWVAAQLRTAARRLSELRLDSFYGRSLPVRLYYAGALLAAFTLLNFLPYSLNHNWFRFQGAPPFQLSRADQDLVAQAKKLLEHTAAENELDKIVADLENGRISSESAQQQLSGLRQQIDSGNLELNNLVDGLTAIANQLGQSAALSSAAQAMAQGDLPDAADQIRELADKLGATPDDVLRELESNLSQAASRSPAALKDLSKLMQNAADALERHDDPAGKLSLDNMAQALEQLSQRINAQQLQSQAGRQLADLQNALQREAASAAAENAQNTPEAAEGENGESGGGTSAANGAPMAGSPSGNSPGGKGGGPSGSSGSTAESKPDQMTKLDVQLKMEGLRGQNGKGGELQDVEEASRQERSTMDYRNVPSQLTPAQKDALNPNRLPREQREIVKYYFEEIRPQTTKAK